MDPRETLTHALPRFLRRCDAESTREAYERELRRFLAWLPAATTDETLFDYRDHLRAKGLGPTTIRWRTTVARSFLLFAQRRGVLDRDLVADFRPPKGKAGFVPRVLTQAELDRLIAAPDRRTAKGRRDAAVLVCLGVGGLRAGEVCRLNVGDVEARPDCVVLTVNGKGRKQRHVPIIGPRAALILPYKRMLVGDQEPDAPLFCAGIRLDHRLAVAGVDYLVRQAAEAAEIPALHPHALRHTAATHETNRGVPLPTVQAKLGHSSVVTTMRYIRPAEQGLWRAGARK